MTKKKKTPTKPSKWAHRYEAAWHECFWKLSEWKQVAIIDDPHENRYSKDLAKETRRLAETKGWMPPKDYRLMPTGIADLKKINNEPF